MRKNQRVADI